MSELLETLGGLALWVALIAVLVYLAYVTWGPVVLGLPTLIGIPAVVGVGSLASNAGLGFAGYPLAVGGLVAVLLVIGMAMRFGIDPRTQLSEDEREHARRLERAED